MVSPDSSVLQTVPAYNQAPEPMQVIPLESGRPVVQALAAAVDAEALSQELERAISGEVRFDRVSRALYSTDASVYQISPIGVVVPRTREDIVRIVQICAARRCPLTMRGGGTSQAGQAIGEGIQIDTSKYYNRLLEVNAEERWARVEPGIVLDELNTALKPRGLRFAPDISTASRATLGGMMANNSSGARSVLYGKTIDHVLEQQVVLADGSVAHFRPLRPDEVEAAFTGESLEAHCYREVRRIAQGCAGEIASRYPKILRRVGGYNLDAFIDPSAPFDLSRLMVGSEGTLGVVLEAKVRLVPLPNAKAVLAIQFSDLLEALRATPVILEHGPSAVEVMDRFILDNTKKSPALDRVRRTFIDGEPGALLCVELYADSEADLPPRLDALEADLVARGFGYRYTRALDAPMQARIWGLREAALGLSMAMREEAKSISFVEDTAVAPDRLADYIERFMALVARHDTTAGVYAHASVGCLHVRPVVNLKTHQGVRTFEALARDVADLVLEFGGALSGEHGDGLVRSPFMRQMFGPVLYEAFRDVKRAFDPLGILNPGKIVDAPPMTANLRYGGGHITPNPQTYFDYSEFGGLGGAVDMCSGLGACRKTIDGTMCPSYMATREEAHSTRGRANVLRLAMTGRLGESGLGDEGVREVLDLCLECRACKAECPVGVDVARFKSEFLADYWRRHGVSPRARVLGHVRELSAIASRVAPVANAVARSGLARRIGERWFGLDARRLPPRWSSRTFSKRIGGYVPKDAAAPKTLIFPDTFTEYFNPSVGLDAAAVLEAGGVAVGLAPKVCCGRPLISQGLLGLARSRAELLVERLHPLAATGRRFVFLEPSCLSSVREDIPDLLRGDSQRRAREVARASILFEELLEQDLESGAARLRLKGGPKTVTIHGHCHQRSMGLVAPAQALLSRIPGASVVDLNAGCCGMAGSFGYARAHYDVSRAIAERRLLPAARSIGPDAVLVASGVSCRHQVEDFAAARALHPAELLRSLLDGAA
ncbi:MAG: FAD-binding and (Fe-S)-binding domain-containing protein [Vicinamibacterales bacterium]